MSRDSFLTVINAAGSAITYSTYLGGTGVAASGVEDAGDIALGSGNKVYLTGITQSGDFQTTTGTNLAGSSDAYVVAVDTAISGSGVPKCMARLTRVASRIRRFPAMSLCGIGDS